MMQFFNLKMGFALLIFLLFLLGLTAYTKINELTEQTEKIYNHPFKVSRSAITINAHLSSMHLYMKDVVLSNNKKEMNHSISHVNHYEELILQEYAVIFKYYLGKRSDIEESYMAFIAWKPIRDEVIKLVQKNRIKEAAEITKIKGEQHVEMLNKKVQILVDFASNKADEFYNEATINDYNSKKIIIILSIFLIFIAVIISKITIDNLTNNLKEKTQYIKKIEELSITDALTGLYNRRHFDTIFPKYLKIVKRLESKMILMMFDIDNFKKYNDTYGHKAGDEVLKAISKALRNKFKREDDYIFRIGGEEFAMIFSIKDQTNVDTLANNVLDAIRELNIVHAHNIPYNIVTVSMGVGIIDKSNNNEESDIYEKVDQLLYDVKKSGKNMFKIEDIH